MLPWSLFSVSLRGPAALHTWVPRKPSPAGIYKCKQQKLTLVDLSSRGISEKDTREISALLGRLENQTWLPQWQKHRACLGKDLDAPTTEYQTLQFTSLILLTCHIWMLGTTWSTPETGYCCFYGHCYQIGPLHSPCVYLSVDAHLESSVYL